MEEKKKLFDGEKPVKEKIPIIILGPVRRGHCIYCDDNPRLNEDYTCPKCGAKNDLPEWKFD